MAYDLIWYLDGYFDFNSFLNFIVFSDSITLMDFFLFFYCINFFHSIKFIIYIRFYDPFKLADCIRFFNFIRLFDSIAFSFKSRNSSSNHIQSKSNSIYSLNGSKIQTDKLSQLSVSKAIFRENHCIKTVTQFILTKTLLTCKF